MPRRSLIRQVIPVYLLVIVLSTVVIAWFAGEAARDFHEHQLARDLHIQAKLIAPQIRELLVTSRESQISDLCNELEQSTSIQIAVITTDGRLLTDPGDESASINNLVNQPEVLDAMTGRVGRSDRFSTINQMRMMYVALPVIHNEQSIAVVRTAIALHEIRHGLAAVYGRIAIGGLAAALVAMVVTIVVFNNRVANPLKQLRDGAQRFASGQLDRNLPVPQAAEIGTLAQVLNHMASQLDAKIQALTRESREHDAILAAMNDGVIAVDRDQRIIALNQGASHLIGVPMNDAAGRSIYQVVRQPDLQQLFKHSMMLDASQPEGTVCITVEDEQRYLQVHGAPLRDDSGSSVGAVVVMHDITQLRRLEMVRRDFVANVSHELKTPITAIKGAAETLQGGGCDGDQVARFAGMITRQSDRLNDIVEDLLALARIELESEHGRVELQPAPVSPVLCMATESCRAKADLQNISLSVDAAPDIAALINPHLLEQAVVNLIDNAIKYSPPDSEVLIRATAHQGRALIEVIDQGQGIHPDHHARIFERFYRTDRARSRDAGGTGLGLAIVKHITQAHGGQIDVQSSLGQGSTFKIWLPA